MGDFTKPGFIWLNGRFIRWANAKIHVLSHAFLYGSGVFEGIRCYLAPEGPALFRLQDHVERLLYSAEVMKMGKALKFTREEIEKACIETVARNGLEECYLRPVLFYGSGKIGLSSTGIPVEAMVAAWPQENYLGEGAAENGIRLTVSRIARNFQTKELANAKVTGHYVQSMLAKTEAVEKGFDEALLLDRNGNVCEGAVENIFIVRDGKLVTPPAQNALDGITRRSVIEIAMNEGIGTQEKFFGLEELLAADEAFMTGTSAEITPIASVDSGAIGQEKPGEITKMLQEKFFAACRGKDGRYKKWLTPAKMPGRNA
ncbi:Amino-transferase class IV [uncultured archaeon]|nr:Amino-transferase class IV [uncultured archaeon]